MNPPMSEATEIPEAKDPFEKRVAVTIAIIAIFLSFVGNFGEKSRTEAIIKTNEASDQWGYFQAKGIKSQMAGMQADLLGNSATASTEATKAGAAKLVTQSERYEGEKAEIKTKAEELQHEAKHELSVNERCERAALFLQLAVVLCSVSILARSHIFWIVGMLTGATGVVVGITAFLM